MSKNERCTCKTCKNTVFHCQIRKFATFVLPSSSWLLKLPKGWFSYNPRYRFDRRCQFKKWSYDWDDYMRTLQKRSLMPAAIGATAIAWIARVLSGRLVADRGDGSDSGDYMRTSLKDCIAQRLSPNKQSKVTTGTIT